MATKKTTLISLSDELLLEIYRLVALSSSRQPWKYHSTAPNRHLLAIAKDAFLSLFTLGLHLVPDRNILETQHITTLRIEGKEPIYGRMRYYFEGKKETSWMHGIKNIEIDLEILLLRDLKVVRGLLEPLLRSFPHLKKAKVILWPPYNDETLPSKKMKKRLGAKKAAKTTRTWQAVEEIRRDLEDGEMVLELEPGFDSKLASKRFVARPEGVFLDSCAWGQEMKKMDPMKGKGGKVEWV